MDKILVDVFTVYQWETTKKVRLGSPHDGGYIVAELEESKYDCYISAGVSDNDSVSYDIIKKLGLNESQCYAFDGTVGSYPSNPPTEIDSIYKEKYWS